MDNIILPAKPVERLSPIDQQIWNEIAPRRPQPIVTFMLQAQRDEEASERLGRPVYNDAVYVAVKVPDEKDYVSRPASDEDKRKWPEAWAQFQATQGKAGTHLRALPGITPARFREFVEMGIRTVEELAKFEGELTEAQGELRGIAKRILTAIKPRYSVVEGKLERVA